MNIAVFETEPREREPFERLGVETIRFHETPLTAENAGDAAEADILSVFVHSRLDAQTLAQLPKLRMIATRSTGYDHIDLDACRARGIVVANVPAYGESTVAEHVFALLLAISHRIVEGVIHTRSGGFDSERFQGFDLAGRTLGVVGTGRIGRHVIRIAQGFDMRVIAYDPYPNPQHASELGFDYVPLDTLLAEADVISLHVPATPQTEHLIGDAEFARMKPGAVLINTARGSIVELTALIRALRSGRLAAVGLDVLPGEPEIREEAELVSAASAPPQALALLAAEQALIHLPNVLVTPHSAFNTVEAVQRIVDTSVDNIRQFLDGHPTNLV